MCIMDVTDSIEINSFVCLLVTAVSDNTEISNSFVCLSVLWIFLSILARYYKILFFFKFADDLILMWDVLCIF